MLADLRSLDFEEPLSPTPVIGTLPRAIPMIFGTPHACDGQPALAVAIEGIVDVRRVAVRPRFRRRLDVTSWIGCSADAQVLLVWSCHESSMERLWDARLPRLLDGLRALDFDIVVGPNFSVFGDAPRAAHIYNMLRNNHLFVDLQAHGLPAVPYIGWFDRHDLEKQIGWLARNPNLRTIALCTQAVKNHRAVYANLRTGIQEIVSELPDTQFLVVGPTTLRARELLDLSAHVHIISTSPSSKATFGGQLITVGDRLTWIRRPRSVHRSQLVRSNLAVWRRLA